MDKQGRSFRAKALHYHLLETKLYSIMSNLKVADPVQLKSGGPIMVISSIAGEIATCKWQDRNESFKEDFELILLKKVDTGPRIKTFPLKP